MRLVIKSFFSKLTKLLALFFCIFSNSFAQPDSTVTLHYPLNIGDFWEYEYVLGGQLFAVERREVIGDTLLSNGKTYRIIDTDFPLSATRYQRIDSMRVYQFNDDEFLLYKLRIQPGDTWNYALSPSDSGYFQVTQIADTSLWSHTFTFARIESFILPDSSQGIAPEDFILVDSIGVIFHGFEGGFLRLRGTIIDTRQFGTITSIQSNDNVSEDRSIQNLQNYPNPFNNSTVIQYKLLTAGQVTISIFNLLGARVLVLYDDFRNPGLHRIHWFGKNSAGIPVSSGIYFYTIQLDNKILAKNSLLFFRRN